MKKTALILLVSLLAFACNRPTNYVLVRTSMGEITIELFDETPLHRDNFQKLVKDGFYDGLLFHRVINEFMIQGGDPDSKEAPANKHLGNGGPGYTLPAELEASPRCFHRKGALAAARLGDTFNKEKASSGSQFYIVMGRKYTESEVGRMEQQNMIQFRRKFFKELSEEKQETIDSLKTTNNKVALQKLQKSLLAKADEKLAADPELYAMDIEQKLAYKEEGGTPHLDGKYTVFGQVIKGIEIVEAIGKVDTKSDDRPVEDIIMSMSFVKAP